MFSYLSFFSSDYFDIHFGRNTYCIIILPKRDLLVIKKTALILGATGLVGKELLQQLVNDHRYGNIVCLLRRPLPTQHVIDLHGKCQPMVVDFEELDQYQGYFKVDHVYVCLGTTIKRAGSRAAFRKVDFEYVHTAAQIAGLQNVKSFVWISSVGASAASKNFYLRVKGELENAIMSISYLKNASAVRPSLLLGERVEHRFGEGVAISLSKILAPLFKGRFRKYQPVHASTVAQQMINLQVF